MGALFNELEKTLSDPQKADEILKSFQEREREWEKFTKKYFNYFQNLSTEDKVKLVQKIIDKYKSDKYRDREFNKCGCFEAREPLYDLIFEYGLRYGEPTESDETYFGSEAYLIDGKIKVTAIYGQGTIIFVEVLN